MFSETNPAKVVFIDRDGVINVDLWKYVERWDEFKFEEDVLPALKKLADNNFKIFIISNQAGVGDGVFTEAALWDIHNKMLAEMEKAGIKIAGTQYCLHGKKAGCDCRKPKTKLLENAVKGVTFEKSKTFFIGDKLGDIEAGKNFGIKTILVRTGYGAKAEKELAGTTRPDYISDNLFTAVSTVLEATK